MGTVLLPWLDEAPIDVVPSIVTVSDAAPALVQFIGVAARVMARMRQVAAGEGPHRRPILLFPEGTTTNGQYLLGFRTGSFIAGVPVQPIILKYGRVRGSIASQGVHKQTRCGGLWVVRIRHSGTVLGTRQSAGCNARQSWWGGKLIRGCWRLCAGRSVSQFDTDHCLPMQSRVSPAWETIGGAWHIFLMLANPLHTVTVYEVTTAAV